MSQILTETADSIATITLNNERRRNVLSHALVEEVVAALHEFHKANVRAVLLRAPAGAKVFCAGHDIDELPGARRDPLGWDDPLRQLIREIENYPGPVIAMVEGSVWGGGTETVLACDMIVAADTATFAVTPAKLGLPYNIGGMLTFLNAVSMHVAKEMIFTAQPVEAARAHRLGMINHVVPAAELESFTLGLARQITANAPLSVAVMKEQLRILAGAHPMTPQGFERIQGLRRVVYDSADYREGLAAFKEKRRPVFRGE
jgi:methylmalonyl-CoA decarboxylase